jgi:hypothetical protein
LSRRDTRSAGDPLAVMISGRPVKPNSHTMIDVIHVRRTARSVTPYIGQAILVDKRVQPDGTWSSGRRLP